MRSRSIAIVVAVWCLYLSAAAEGQDSWVRRGNELIGRGNYAAAERLFRNALSADPGNQVYRSQLGLTLVQQKRFDEAELELQTALRQDPNDPATLWYLALNKFFADAYREAVGRFKTVLPLLEQTLAKTINGEMRTQDAPFVARGLLMTVDGRELAWSFVKAQWDTMDRLYPKHGLRRMCEGVTGLATPELERDVHAFFADRKADLGGRTLEQYLEQLRIAVALREREGAALAAYLAAAP